MREQKDIRKPSSKALEAVSVNEGDCIACGALCQPSIYCCTDPAPLAREEAETINKKGGYRASYAGYCLR